MFSPRDPYKVVLEATQIQIPELQKNLDFLLILSYLLNTLSNQHFMY